MKKYVFLLFCCILAVTALSPQVYASFPETEFCDSSDTLHPDYMVGTWMEGLGGVGSSYPAILWLEEDGVFTWMEDPVKTTATLRGTSGEWYVKDDVLYLSASVMLVYVGGEEVENKNSMLKAKTILIGGEVKRIEIAPGYRIVEAYPISWLEEFRGGLINLRDDWPHFRNNIPTESGNKQYMISLRDNDMA